VTLRTAQALWLQDQVLGIGDEVAPLSRNVRVPTLSSPVIGYTTGVFDLFHIGHLNLLRAASAGCDQLIVGVTTDELSCADKGRRPVIPFAERAAIVAAIRGVDRVVPQLMNDKARAWEELRFNKLFVGDDWRGTPRWNALEAELIPKGVLFEYLPYTQHISSSRIRSIVAPAASV
jgi:glycerol-3-phosphate cytidylyltransferase